MSDSLFRQEAIDNQRERLLGDVILAQPISHHVMTTVIVVVICVALGFLFWGSYARKETVQGYLVPNMGVIKIYPSRPGVFETVHVQEGDTVSTDQPLVTVTAGEQQQNGLDTDSLISEEIENQINELKQRIDRAAQTRALEENRLNTLLKGLNVELAQLDVQKSIRNERLLLSQNSHKKLSRLQKAGHISEVDLKKDYANLLMDRSNVESIKQEITNKQNSLSQAKFKLSKLPLETEERIAAMKGQMSDLNQRMMEIKGHRSYTLKAPREGKVLSLQVHAGQAAAPRQPVMSLLPAGASLEVQLFVPTRAIGFVEPGQRVRLQYDAFPYQRFGMQYGTVTKLSKAILAPNELPIPIRLEEAVYRVNVELDKQHVLAFGKRFPLKTGMLLRADIILDTRSLFDWLLEPLYSLKGRM